MVCAACGIDLMLLLGLSAAGSATLVFSLTKSSGAYKGAIAAVHADRQTMALPGPPVEPGWFIMGKLEVSGASGRAEFSIPQKKPCLP